MALLTDDWGYPVVQGDLDPNDPVVNTASEYVFQMATVAYHTLHSVQTVVLTEDAEYSGELFPAGEYEFAVDGRYWADFDRSHPIEGPARAQAWTATAHALIGELGVGTATASALQLGLAIAALFAGIGGIFFLGGIGLIWATRAETVPVVEFKTRLEPIPARTLAGAEAGPDQQRSASFHPVLALGATDATQVRVAEVGRQLEAVAERSVHADVGEQDGPGKGKPSQREEPADPQRTERDHQVVGAVVGDRANTCAGQVADHREIRSKQQGQKQQRMAAHP